MSKTLAGKVALVTGGSRGIGAAIAKQLARDGATVAISYSTSAEKAEAVLRELENLGVKAAAFKADQADPAQVEGLVKTVTETFGRLDILVNNAGVFVMGAVDDAGADIGALNRQLAINVGGVATAVRAGIEGDGTKVAGSSRSAPAPAPVHLGPASRITPRRKPRSRCTPGGGRAIWARRASR